MQNYNIQLFSQFFKNFPSTANYLKLGGNLLQGLRGDRRPVNSQTTTFALYKVV